MKISIVTISLNQIEFLKRCIDSVLSQDYPDVEYIVVDPGSRDGSRELIASYGTKLTHLFRQDTGAAQGLNNGFRIATGQIFGFINSDDFLLPGSLRAIAEVFRMNPTADVVLGAGWIVNRSEEKIRFICPTPFSAWMYLHGAVTVFQQGAFFKATVYRQSLGFNESNRSCWDGELLLTFARNKARFVTSQVPVACFRIYPESISGSGRLLKPYRTDLDRMFQETYGRSPNIADRFLTIIARILKLARKVI